MKKEQKRILALLMAFALILQYSFSASFLSVYAEGEQTEVTQTESSTSEAKAAEPAPAPEPASAPAASESKAEPAPAPAAEPADSGDSAEAAESQATEEASEGDAPADNADAAESEGRGSSDAVAEEDPASEEEAVEEEEEVKYPADTFKGSAGGVSVVINAPEGALPEGTKLEVSAVSADEVKDAVEGAIGTEAATIKAVDITFVYEGEKIEPKKAVKVHLNASGMDSSADKKVVHIADSGAADVVTDNVSSSGAASFSAKEFSIYLVVDQDVDPADENAVATYEFYVEDELVMTQYIKTGDKLTDPGTSVVKADDANTVFKGWFIGDDAVDFDTAQTVDETKTVRVEAKIQHTYYVTFWGEPDNSEEKNRGIVAVKSVTVEGSESGEVSIDDVTVTPKADTSAFKGWSESPTGTETISGNTVSVSDRMDLYAVVVNAHWIHFYENVGKDSDSDATYTGPVFVADTDVRSTKKPADPTRDGYTFGGWYLDEECSEGKEFDWTATGLEKDTDLYAKWIPGTAEFHVIVWKQKVTDAKDAADSDKTYDFELSAPYTGTTGEELDLTQFSMYTELDFTGFHYSRMEAKPATVRADGSTVVNVYYDRNLLTIHFVDGTHTEYEPTTGNQGTQYGLIDGEYIALTRNGNNWTYQLPHNYSGTTYRSVTNNQGTQYGFVNGQMVQLTYHAQLFGGYWTYGNNVRYYGTRYATPATGNSGFGIVDGAVTGISNQDGEWVYTTTERYTGTRYRAVQEPTITDYTGLYGSTLESNGYTWPGDRAWYQNPNAGGTRLTFLDAFKFEGLSGTSENDTVLTQYGANQSGNNYIRFYKQNINGSWPAADSPTDSIRSGGGTFTITEKYEGFKAVQYAHGGNWTSGGAGTSTSATNLQIRFERQKFTLTLMSESDVFDTVADIPYEDSLAQHKPSAEPTKAHYDFVGWYEDPTGQTEFDWSSTMPAANKVIYAKFVPKQYHVLLDPDGGEFINAQVGDFNVPLDTILDKTSLMTNVVKQDHELVGWFDKATGEAYGYGKIEDDVNLIAKWRYPGQVKIVYDATPHGSGAPEDKYLYATDSAVVLGAPPTTVDEGFAFVGWSVNGKKYYTNNTFDITEDIIEDYDPETKTGTITITAIYQKLGTGALTPTTITYDPNGGTGTAKTIDTGAHGDLLINEPIIALAVDDSQLGFTREGFKFVEWNTDPNGGGLAVAAGDDIAGDLRNLEKNTDINTLYAQWCKVYTVTFDPDGGTPDPDDQTVKSGEKATEPDDPNKENNDFLGWFEVIDGEMADTEFDFNTAITKDTDLKAKWEPTTVTVTFDANGHGTAPDAQTIDKGATATKPADLSEAGFEFGGWFTEAACTNEFDFATPVNEDKTLYAKWTPIKYTVTFDANGHGTAPDAQTVDAGKTATKPTDPSESGFVFGGWFTDADCTTEYDFSTPVKSDMTLYAKWTEAGTATITYHLNGGTYNGSTANIEENYKIGEVISIHAAPEREGYVFSYWQGSAYQPGDSYTVEGDHTFTAVWVAIEETDDDSDKSDKTDKSKGVKTGDEADLAGWLMLMLIAGAGTGYVALSRRREED